MVLGEALRQTGGCLPRRRGAMSEDESPDADGAAGAAAWFEALRDRICAALRGARGRYAGPDRDRLAAGRFERQAWDRPGGGGGVMA